MLEEKIHAQHIHSAWFTQQADDEPDRVPIGEEEQGGKTRAIVR